MTRRFVPRARRWMISSLMPSEKNCHLGLVRQVVERQHGDHSALARQRRLCRRRGRGGVVLQRQCEAVAAPRYGGDGVGAEHLAQRRDLHREVVLLHHHAGPDPRQQLVLADHAIALLDQREQQVERAPAQRDRLAIGQQAALGRSQLQPLCLEDLAQSPCLVVDPNSRAGRRALGTFHIVCAPLEDAAGGRRAQWRRTPTGLNSTTHPKGDRIVNQAPIKIGLVTDQTGPLSFLGIANANLARLVVDDMNAAGGLLGRRIELITEDSATDDSVAAAKAAKLVQRDRVDAIFGGIYSSTRQAIKGPAVVQGKTLYIYPEQYEGEECDPLIFCTGPVPAQQVDSLIPWLMKHTDARRFYLPSADYIWPHVMNKRVRAAVTAHGGSVVGEEYFPVDHTDYRDNVRNIMASGAQVVFNTTVPPGVAPFLQQLHEAGFTKRGGRIVCTYFEENFASLLPAEHVEGLYSCLDYYQAVSDPFSQALLAPLRRALPGERQVHCRQCEHGAVSRIEALAGGGQGGRHARAGGRDPRARPRAHRRRAGRARRNGARPASPAAEHVRWPGAGGTDEGHREPGLDRSRRARAERAMSKET